MHHIEQRAMGSSVVYILPRIVAVCFYIHTSANSIADCVAGE